MDDLRFDRFVRSLAEGQSRRALLKSLVGFGGAAVAGASLADRADAARRGFSGPALPTPCVPQCDGTSCGSDGCGGTCACPHGTFCLETFGNLCFHPCDPEEPEPCGAGCICDLSTIACVADHYGNGCLTSADCPSGWFCYHNGVGTYCATPCPHGI